MNIIKQERWSPYAAGALIGVLSACCLLFFKKTIGTSTSFVKPVAFLWSILNKTSFEQNAFFREVLNNKAWFDWQLMLVIGIFLGAYLSRRLSKTPPAIAPPSRFNLRPFIGGVILMLGARLAGGCTSGHAITGGTQMAVSGWLFMMGVFALGIPTARLLYRTRSVS